MFNGVAVFDFDSINFNSSVDIYGIGSLPVALLSRGDITAGGLITGFADGNVPGPGGFAPGAGPGAGSQGQVIPGTLSTVGGSGGGGFGGSGGAGAGPPALAINSRPEGLAAGLTRTS